MRSEKKATGKFGHRIAAVLRADPETFVVRIQFARGPTVDVQLAHLFAHPKGLCAEVLRGDLFGQCFVESGALAWPNGLELCPDAMYQWADRTRAAKRVA